MSYDEMLAQYGLEYVVRELEKRVTALEATITEPTPEPPQAALEVAEGDDDNG